MTYEVRIKIKSVFLGKTIFLKINHRSSPLIQVYNSLDLFYWNFFFLPFNF